jgi:hypothetical protein
MEQAGYSVGWSLGRLGQHLRRTANTLRADLMEITTEASAITTKAGRQPAWVREKTAVGTTDASQIKPHHHELSGETKLDGDAARLATGGMSLSALLIRRLFFPAFALPTGLGTGLGLAVTIATGYPFFRNGLRTLTPKTWAASALLIPDSTACIRCIRRSRE